MNINVIVAVDSKYGIGKDGKIPWRAPDDMKHFKKITTNCPEDKINAVIMGRKTFDSIGKILPGRINIILSREKHDSTADTGIIFTDAFDKIPEICSKIPNLNDIFIIGGAQIYKHYLENTVLYNINKIYLTQINGDYECDVKFTYIPPNFIINEYKQFDDGYFITYQQQQRHEHDEYQYLKLIRNVILTGDDRDDRTGVGTLSKFGCQMRFDLSKGFPLLTTKKVFIRGIIQELLWFLRGSTDSKELEAERVNIWKGNTSREFLDNLGLKYEEGDGGAIYGFQMRHFGAKYVDCKTDYTGQGFDQIAYVLDQIKNNPRSRRIVMNLWNPPDLCKSCLPPCHVLYQWYVSTDNKLSCQLYQRSGDLGLGVPFNIASASIMTMIFARLTGLKLGEFIHTIGDAHIYKNHIEPLERQLKRKPMPFPKLEILDRGQENIEDFIYSDFELVGYFSHPGIKMEMAV
jgi:dihydrofolate reductase/thymidylate synthase